MDLENFKNWLAGIIDSDGGLYISKQNSISCEITMHEKEVQTLYYIKKKIGGKVSKRTNKKAYRWRLHNSKQIIELCNLILGKLRTEKKIVQFKKVCNIINENYIEPEPLTFKNSWLAGFFSGDGYFSINKTTFQSTIGISQKEEHILQEIQKVFCGNIYRDESWNGWIWQVSSQKDLNNLFRYFETYPMHNPYKIAKYKSFRRYRFFIERGDHIILEKKKKISKYIQKFQTI
jgi:DNA-binding transcriptional regulator WhiA